LLEADLAAGQGAREGRGLTASLGAFEDDGRAKSALVRVEQGDEKRVVALGDAAKFALWSVSAEVDMSRHRAGMVPLAETAGCSLDAL